jgi:cephalosporin hydroxylase
MLASSFDLSTSEIVDGFHNLYYNSKAWNKNQWLGYPIRQCPMDLQVYQEIIFRTRPKFVLQTGVLEGGSLLFFASLFDLMGMDENAIVVGVDIELTPQARTLKHPRIRLVKGSSTAPRTVKMVESLLPGREGFVSLDSDHSEAHVREELRLYARFVAVGSYLVVEDTNINGHPVRPDFGPGPTEAVEDFLQTDTRFTRADETWKRNLMSFHQGGWLKRTS